MQNLIFRLIGPLGAVLESNRHLELAIRESHLLLGSYMRNPSISWDLLPPSTKLVWQNHPLRLIY